LISHLLDAMPPFNHNIGPSRQACYGAYCSFERHNSVVSIIACAGNNDILAKQSRLSLAYTKRFTDGHHAGQRPAGKRHTAVNRSGGQDQPLGLEQERPLRASKRKRPHIKKPPGDRLGQHLDIECAKTRSQQRSSLDAGSAIKLGGDTHKWCPQPPPVTAKFGLLINQRHCCPSLDRCECCSKASWATSNNRDLCRLH
jgi:hypothetical protein